MPIDQETTCAFFWHLENLKDEFTKVEQRKLNKCFKYLKRNYFSPDKGYNRKDFDYHSQILNGENTLSTNPIENQNHQLKIFMGAGRLPFNKLGRKLNEYHTEHVGSYISNVVKNNAPKRRKHIVDRETETFDIINEFYEIENIHDRLNNLPEFCIRLGFLNQDFCDPKYYDNFSDKIVEEVLSESDSDSEDLYDEPPNDAPALEVHYSFLK